jgi:hypothetical protein
MKRTLIPLSCLLFVPTYLYSAELAKDGATGWKVVLPNEPMIVEKTAARELSEHLTLVTGADFQTIAENDVPADGQSFIFVGHTAKAPKEDYRFDEILIKITTATQRRLLTTRKAGTARASAWVRPGVLPQLPPEFVWARLR